ncbi:MAG: hypothetical protein GX856_01160 [Gammaproteobacteria bacterium]|nr:hypothetical protein [Gammaproteobacteria bacterium]
MDAAPAPEFPSGLEWLNTAEPLRMSQLLGRVSALAFVNAGSAWCMQTLVDLGHLRNRHPDRLNVVAVHVPRFEHEREGRRVIRRFSRNRFAFPIGHDPDWVLWQHYGIEAWPTVVLVDAAGQVRERFVGDGQLRDIDAAITRLQSEIQPRSLNEERIEMRRGGEPMLPLRFPIGLALSGNYLYVADSGHHRVLECDLSGRVLRQFGSGGAGFIDGPMELAAFNRPHGLCVERDTLYIADTGNHAVRRIQLRGGDIDTVVGAGRPGTPAEGPVSDPRMVVLDQPRAVSLAAGNLYIATAGDNRVWRFHLGAPAISRVAGSGSLAVVDGPRDAAAFAEPSSLASVQQVVYVCDAAGSAIRSANARSGQVATLVGVDAWTHGDADGPRGDARLQHPQAIALDPDAPVLWIADSGNDRLRSLRLGGGELTTVELPQRLHAPGGLAVADGSVWIADTDAHAVLRYDTRDGSLKHVPIGE